MWEYMGRQIELQINGELVAIEPCSLAHYIDTCDLDITSLIVECNGSIIRQEEWSDRMLAEGDHLELLSFVGGG